MSGFANPNTPNLPDYLVFLNTQVQIPKTALPSDSPWPGWVFYQAQQLVLQNPMPIGIWYSLAVYNCATHLLFMTAPDQPGQTYFADARSSTGYSLITPSTGLVLSSNDQGTGASLIAPKWGDGLTVQQLDMYKTPWGRWYLTYAQSYGPTIVALS